jgi:hypothetical protein
MLLTLLLTQGTAGPVTHATTGTLAGPGSAVAGSAARTAGAVTHATTGALTGPGSTVAGSATRFRSHATSGALTGQLGTVSGTARHNIPHPSSGTLTGQLGSVAGTAARSAGPVTHPTSGALAGQVATVTGAASRLRAFSGTGTLTGQGSALAGSAARVAGAVTHDATGALVGPISIITGTADPEHGAVQERGDGVGRRWKKRELRDRDRRLEEYRQDKAQLRKLIEQAIDPVAEGETVKVVTTADKKAVVIAPASAPAIAIPAIKFDVRQVSAEIGKVLAAAKIEAKRVRDAESKRIAEEAYRVAVDNMRVRMKRRREEELLLLM